MTDYDVIIVGAGPAGCGAAWDLGRRGRSVLLLDRHQFPRAKACGGGLTIKTLRALRYSVSPVVQQVCNRMRISLRNERPAILSAPSDICAMVVREEFDAYCLQETRDAGAEFRTIGRLMDVTESSDGVVIDTDAGPWRSRFLIGADGADSRVRKLSDQFHPDRQALAIECQIPREPLKSNDMDFDFHVVPHGYGWAFPKAEHWNVGVAALRASSGKALRRLLKDYVDQKFPGSQMTQTIGHRVGIGGWNYQPTSERVFLVGDAAGFCEPMLAEGIHNAIASGQVAAQAIEHNLATGESALQRFRQGLKPIWQDLRSCRRGAGFFYRYPRLGYSILAKPMFHRPLLGGFAQGQAVATIRPFGRLLSW
ncbi:MAG: geranylgeranyl reductase family protein [Pirellulaceae bacterium]